MSERREIEHAALEEVRELGNLDRVSLRNTPHGDLSKRLPEIKLWDHVRYGHVNVEMLKTLLAAGKKLKKPC